METGRECEESGACGELAEVHSLVVKFGTDFELAAEGLDDAAKGADLHILAAFHFGEGRLLHAEFFGELGLGGAALLAEFGQKEALHDARGLGLTAGHASGVHFGYEFLKVACHYSSPSLLSEARC